MTAQNATCPPEAALADFGLGKLDAASAETVSQHLETCHDCRQRVASLSGDSFVGRLREARPKAAVRARTFVPGESLANAANSTDGSMPKENGLPRPSRPSRETISRDGLGSPSSHADGLGSPSSPAAPPELANHPDFELVKELGQGGMGTVYLARNRMMDRLEVLKVISTALLDRPGALERFQQEIRSAAKLNHPNIVAAHSVSRPGNLLVFAMEYVRGQDLSQVVKARGALPVANAAFYTHQVALGLQHAHEKGMVHRDIKPNNLMLTIEGKKHVVKILDFGLSKATSEKGAESGLTKSGQMLGTPDYIAPEQTLDAHQADIRADIYSLGCTLYALLSGGPPFQESSLYGILEAHQKREARLLNLVRPEVPAELAAVVAKMMAKNPQNRYQTPQEVARALVPFFKPGQSVPPPSPTNASHPPSTGETADAMAATTPPPLAAPPIAVALPMAARAVMPVPAAVDMAESIDHFSLSIDIQRAAPARSKRPAARRAWRMPELPRYGWAILAGLLPAVVLLIAGLIFSFKTSDGIVVVEVNVENPEISIDGDRATVTWDDGGKRAEISLAPGSHEIELTKDGFEASGERVAIEAGGRALVSASLKPVTKLMKADQAAPAVASGPSLSPDAGSGGGGLTTPPANTSTGIQIIEARWGGADVTEDVRANVRDGRYLATAVNEAFGGKDPARGFIKSLVVQYSVGGESRSGSFREGQVVYLAADDSPPRDATGLTLLEARCGWANDWFDVVERLRPLARQNFLLVKPDFATAMGSGASGPKAIFVRYVSNGEVKRATASNGEMLCMDARPPAAINKPVDLLKEINPKRDALRGSWEFRAGRLIMPAIKEPLLEVFYSLPAEYELTAVVECAAQRDCLILGLPVGGSMTALAIDSRLQTSGLSLLDGEWLGRNATAKQGRFMRDGSPNTIVCRVKNDSIQVSCNGKQVIDWTGESRRLSVQTVWQVRDPRRMFLSGYFTPFEISKLELAPLNEKAAATPSAPTAEEADERDAEPDSETQSPEADDADGEKQSGQKPSSQPSSRRPAKPIELLKQLNVKQPGTVGDWRMEKGKLVFPQVVLPSLAIFDAAPEEYTLRATVLCPSHVGALSFGIVVADSQAIVAIDGQAKQSSALGLIDGREGKDNATRIAGTSLFDGMTQNHIEITVRKNRVQLFCNRRQLIDWKGNPSSLSLPSGYAGRHGAKQLFISMGQPSPFVVTKLTLQPLRAVDDKTATSARPKKAKRTAKSDRWRPLFNGKNLAGWTDPEQKGTWQVVDGSLTNQSGWRIHTDKSYSNFSLMFEFQVSADTAASIDLLATPDDTPLWVFLDNTRSAMGAITWDGREKGFSVNRLNPPAELKPDGQWNEMTIELRESILKVSLNGRELGTANIKDHMDRRRPSLPPEQRQLGKIGLHKRWGSGTVLIRKLFIKEL